MAGPIPFEITVNGEDFTIVRTRDDINPSWADEQSANSTLYSISGNTVVWENGGILQLNSVDVLPTDEIDNTSYTTRAATSRVSVDLTTLPGWSALSDGEHTVQIVAKGTGYRDSEKSTSVTVTKGGSTGETWILNDTIDISTEFSETITFTTNNQTASSIDVQTSGFPKGLIYYIGAPVIVYNASGWTDANYKTITFETAPTGELLTWLQANGEKQEV